MNPLNLTIPGFTIACKIWGKPENPPVIALHGWLDNANSFDFLADYLQEHYYFIAIDLPGHGHSSHLPAGSNYHFIDGVISIIHILDALQLDKVHLLGHSMGACLASLAGGVAPERFLSLALIEGLGPFSAPEETACAQLAAYMKSMQKLPQKSKKYTLLDAAGARASKGYVSLDIAKKLSERGVREDEGMYSWRHDSRLLIPTPLYMTENQILSCLKEITAKTSLFWASKGFAFDSKLMQGRIDSVKDLKIHQLEGGHHVHMEKPEVLSKLLIDFFGH